VQRENASAAVVFLDRTRREQNIKKYSDTTGG
jgi:hypothetical protein